MATTYDDYGPVRIEYKDVDPRYEDDIFVQVRGEGNTWVTVGKFNSMSDDYAMTNAKDCAKRNIDNINKARVVSHGATLAQGSFVNKQ